VVKGSSQKQGIDYHETFAPVIRYETVRTMLAVSAAKNFAMVQFDVSTAFLNSPLVEDDYMYQPDGCKTEGDFVCKLKRGMYGLKLSPRNWHNLMKEKLLELGFRQSLYDPCLFICTNSEGNTLYIGLYVDDGIIMQKDINHLHAVRSSIEDNFKITWTTDVKKFFGLEINNNNDCLQLLQEEGSRKKWRMRKWRRISKPHPGKGEWRISFASSSGQ